MNVIYIIYAVVMGIFSWFTGELITFIMLGFILIALNNILNVLKEIARKLN